jgi:hypothetical protein
MVRPLMIVARVGPMVVRVLGMAAVAVISFAFVHRVPPAPDWMIVLARVAAAAIVIGTVTDISVWRLMAVVFRDEQVDLRSSSQLYVVPISLTVTGVIVDGILSRPGRPVEDVGAAVMGCVSLIILIVGLGLTAASATGLRVLRLIYGAGFVVIIIGFVVVVSPLYLPGPVAY